MIPSTAAKRLFLVDGSALAYRSFFAFIRNPLVTSKGQNTSAVFGFTMALRRILEQESPDRVLVVFDTPEPTFRHRKFAQYKATREKMPDEMRDQLPWIRNVVTAMGIRIVECPGFEADDVIGTLARKASELGYESFLVSGDKDFLQLVDDRVRIFHPGRSGSGVEILGRDEVREKFGVPPDRVIDVLALMGDSSDNVPGVPGIGEKTATKIVKEYGSLDEVYGNLDRVGPPGVRKKLAENREQAFLSRELVTIDTSVPIGFSEELFETAPPDPDRLSELYHELEFRSLAESMESDIQSDEHEYSVVLTPEELDAVLRRLQEAPEIVVDLETTTLEPLDARIVGVSLAFREREAFYLPANVDPPLCGTAETAATELMERLRPVLEDARKKKVGQNLLYDCRVLLRYGITLEGIDFDTMIASYCIEPGLRQHNLDSLAARYLNYKKVPTSDLIGKGAKEISMEEVPVEKAGEYACEDADFTLRLKSVLCNRMRELGVADLFREVEIPLIQVLVEMEEAGVRLDVGLLRRMSARLEEEISALEKEIHELAGEPFNVNSPVQLGPVLFERLKIHEELGVKRLRRTKTGYATDQQTLERYSSHPIVEKILAYRQLAKLKNTYVDALPTLVHPATGKVHTSFNQTVAATGRLSSSDPNLQNIPIRTDLGREIRKAFIPGDESHRLLGADYNQIELRILAHMTGDDRLVAAFRGQEDIHRQTAAVVFGMPPEEVTPDHRSRAKAINFGVLYGMGPDRLAAEVKISRKEAQAFIAAYFEQFHSVREFLDRTIEEARRNGYVTTLLGRRRYIPEILSQDARVRRNAENIAVNTPIQGSAADLIKKAMVEIHREMRRREVESKMILQVHDELLFEVPEGEVEEMTDLVRSRMEGAMELRVPVTVDVRIGRNWYEAH